MPMRAYKIKEISLKSTFDLIADSPLWSILSQAGLLKDLGEAGGLVSFDEDDLQEVEKLLAESSGEIPEEEVSEIKQIIDEIRDELDPTWAYVFYHCF
jgi:hypothetical protein